MVASQVVDNETATNGASVVVLRRDAVLMVERARPPFQGLWSFPGGRSEPGEDPAQTARRELREETGLEVNHLIRIGTAEPQAGISRIAVFAARAEGGLPKAGDDAARAEFVPFSDVLMRRTTDSAAGWIAHALAALAEPPLP